MSCFFKKDVVIYYSKEETVFFAKIKQTEVDTMSETEEYTYAKSGVDRNLRKESKIALSILEQTYKSSRYGGIMKLPFGNIFPNNCGGYTDFGIEGVGTKVLLAQLAEKYDTIGIDGVAMIVNDIIRSGAEPYAIADNIHAVSSDPDLVRELLKGIVKGAEEADCLISGGEIGDVAEIIKGVRNGEGFDIVVSAIGEVLREHIISGDEIVQGDVVIGLPSSGVHSNGVSMERKVLFKQWGGKFDPFDVPDGFDREIVLEALESTKIYVDPVISIAQDYIIKGAIHITGDAYLKFGNFMEFSPGIGFWLDNFHPQPIFNLIQKTAKETRGKITDEEMFKTFNMGWGFGLVVYEEDAEEILSDLERIGGSAKGAEIIGKATNTGKIVINNKKRKFELKR